MGLDLVINRKQVDRINSVSDTEFTNVAKTLNEKQKVFFYHVLHKVKTDDLPIYCFLTGGAGVGKSLLTMCLFQAVSRFFAKPIAENANKVKAVCANWQRSVQYWRSYNLFIIFHTSKPKLEL